MSIGPRWAQPTCGAHASGHRVELVELGLRIALADGFPERVLTWAELGRASHLLLRPVRPPDEPVLAESLGELRSVVAEIGQLQASGRTAARSIQRQVALERRIRDYCRLQQDCGTIPLSGPVALSSLGAALGEVALIEFVILDETLHALTVVGGRARLHAVGVVADVHELVERIAFTLRRLAHEYATAASRSAAGVLLRHSAATLEATVLGAVAADVGDRPLVIIPTGPLQSVPWSVLPSCAGRAVAVAPSAALWYFANRRAVNPATRVAVVGCGLPGALVEAETVAALHGTDPVLAAGATVAAVTAAVNGAALAHLATHGRLHQRNPPRRATIMRLRY